MANKNIAEEAGEMLKTLLKNADNAIELHNGIYGRNGVFRKIARTKAERESIAALPIFKKAQKKLSRLRKGDAEEFRKETDRAIEKKRQLSRINIIVPKSLHLLNQDEAKEEGVSLSELIRLKISEPYGNILKNRLRSKRDDISA